MGHSVICAPDDVRARVDQRLQRVTQLLVGRSDLQAEVIHANAPPARDRGCVRAHLDQQQLVVRPPRRIHRHLVFGAGDLLPAQEVSVEASRPLHVSHVQDDVTELLDLHPPSFGRRGSQRSRAPRTGTGLPIIPPGRRPGSRPEQDPFSSPPGRPM